MVRVLMHGCCGAMGRVITGLAADREDLKIVAGVDRNTDDSLGYPVFQSLEACDVGGCDHRLYCGSGSGSSVGLLCREEGSSGIMFHWII